MRQQFLSAFVLVSTLAWGAARASGQIELETKSDIDQLVRQLDADTFAARQAASNELADMGAKAFPALEMAALSGGSEVVQRAIGILAQHFEHGEDEVKVVAKAALERIAAAGGFAGGRAKEIIAPQPPPAPGARARVGIPLQIQVRAIRGGGNGRKIQIQQANGVRRIKVEEQDRQVEIQEDPNKGIKLEVTTKKDGKETTEKYEAKDAAELKQKHPEAHKIYEQYKQQGGGIRIQARPARAANPPALPVPRIAPPNRQQSLQRSLEGIDRMIDKIEKQAQQGDGRTENYKRMIESLKQHRERIADSLKNLPAEG